MLRHLLLLYLLALPSDQYCRVTKGRSRVECRGILAIKEVAKFPDVASLALIGITDGCTTMDAVKLLLPRLGVIQVDNSEDLCACLMAATVCGVSLVGCGSSFYESCPASDVSASATVPVWVAVGLLIVVAVAMAFGFFVFYKKADRAQKRLDRTAQRYENFVASFNASTSRSAESPTDPGIEMQPVDHSTPVRALQQEAVVQQLALEPKVLIPRVRV